MSGTSRRAVLLGAVGLLGAGALAACSSDETPEDSDGVDTSYVSGDGTATEWAPDRRTDPVELAGQTMAGDAVDLAEWRGAPVVLNFWYATCPPCRKEAPDLQAASERTADVAQFIGIDSRDASKAQPRAFMRAQKISYPSIFDPDGSQVVKFSDLPPSAIPSTLIIDKQGRVAVRVLGTVTEQTLVDMINDVAAGK